MTMLAQLIETLSRPGLLGIVGRTAEKRLTRALEAYFRTLGRHVITLNLEGLSQHDPQLLQHALGMRLHNTLRILTPLLKTTLEVAIQDAMLKTNSIHHFSEAAGDNPLTDEPPALITSEEAAQYASERSAELVTGINDTTRSLLQDAIEQGLRDQLSSDQTARLIRQTFQDMTIQRSRLIATTEMADAMSEAMLRKLDRLGIEYKRWILSPEACDICEENAAQGAIPVDDDFESGDDRPPAHPNCRCAVVGARAPVVQ